MSTPGKQAVEDQRAEPDTQSETIRTSSNGRSRSISPEGQRPPLPPRPSNLALLTERSITSSGTSQPTKPSTRPSLLSKATTALSLTDINTQINPHGSREQHTSTRQGPAQSGPSKGNLKHLTSTRTSEGGDSSSVRSYLPNASHSQEVESIFGDVLGGWQDESEQGEKQGLVRSRTFELDQGDVDFDHEFEDVGELDSDAKNEESLLESWKSKQKHFIILSSAGKPIYTRHGNDGLISGYVGIIQTIISFYKGADDPLRTFSAGGAKFVILLEGPLYLVAISRFLESDAQLRAQLEALYMQILSTLTLPTLTHLFSVRPSTDLRRPLQGTDTLLSSLADSFTRGSPTTLLSALECLKIRKSHRQVINSILLKARVESLLYGLVVAGGRLVSVIRPKKHSLHPSDLQLIFNMLFEADGVKAGGGESWIPICLPGFNSRGYLYMYVSFLDLRDDPNLDPDEEMSKEDAVATLFISADKEAFFEMRKMRDDVVEQLRTKGSMQIIKQSVHRGRLSTTDIVPGTVLRHFLYKSKGNVQFIMPSYAPVFTTPTERRRLLSTYHVLHASVHAKHAHVKVHHSVGSMTALAWVTPMFELYCVAAYNASRNALAQGANKVIQWVQREEERIFIIGGAVF